MNGEADAVLESRVGRIDQRRDRSTVPAAPRRGSGRVEGAVTNTGTWAALRTKIQALTNGGAVAAADGQRARIPTGHRTDRGHDGAGRRRPPRDAPAEPATLEGGTMEGAGTVKGNLVNGGRVAGTAPSGTPTRGRSPSPAPTSSSRRRAQVGARGRDRSAVGVGTSATLPAHLRSARRLAHADGGCGLKPLATPYPERAVRDGHGPGRWAVLKLPTTPQTSN